MHHKYCCDYDMCDDYMYDYNNYKYCKDVDWCCDMPKFSCKTEKKCVKTFKSVYKLYKVCQYRLYKICSCCGSEYDFYRYNCHCPRCGH